MENTTEQLQFKRSVRTVIAVLAALWLIFLGQYAGLVPTQLLGNRPQTMNGLIGIITSPLLHGSIEHLASNSLPLLVLLTALLNAYANVALLTVAIVYVGSGAVVWLTGSVGSIHIGFSGVVYGIAFFLISAGFMRKDKTSMGVALFTILLYGGLAEGFIPKDGISWQSHAAGAILGMVAAYILQNKYLLPPQPVEQVEPEDDRPFFEKLDNPKSE